jgi:hypothetical protein
VNVRYGPNTTSSKRARTPVGDPATKPGELQPCEYRVLRRASAGPPFVMEVELPPPPAQRARLLDARPSTPDMGRSARTRGLASRHRPGTGQTRPRATSAVRVSLAISASASA